jgi:hypothetical protein
MLLLKKLKPALEPTFHKKNNQFRINKYILIIIIDLSKKIKLNLSCIGFFNVKSQNQPQILLFDSNKTGAKQIIYQKTGYQH